MRKSDIVFFATGLAALVYETTWARLLARTLGSDASAAAIVVATFMAGLALGALLFAGRARRTAEPVRLFVALELAAAGWAALSPEMLAHIPPIESTFARVAVAAAILLIPTLCMGATFPLMARLTVRTRAEAGSEVSAFYGANTLGAAAGALIAPFVLMPVFGLSGALRAAAVLDALAAAIALRLLDAAAAPGPESRARGFDPLFAAVFLLGAASLALEVSLLRVLITITGASVFAFGIVLAVFLLGLGLGSRQFADARAPSGVADSQLAERATKARNVLFFASVCAPLLVVGGLFALRLQLGESDLFVGLSNRIPQGASIVRTWLAHALFAGLCLLPPAIAFGMALPSAAGLIATRHPEGESTRWIARLYAWNTSGALCGSLLAAFVAIPLGGPRAAVAAALALPFFAALVVDRARLSALAIGVLTTAVVATQSVLPASGRDARPIVLLAHDAHTSASVEDVRTTLGDDVRSLRVNGKAEASTAQADMRLQYLLGHIPGLVHADVERALVVGLGTGMTAGALLDLPTLKSLEIVEISPAVARAAHAFDAWNGKVLDDPRTHLTLADGRHRIATAHETWDLVTSDPVHPWTRGSSDLYTLEHFQAIAAHLAPGGIASQWLPLYELSTDDVRTIAATWCAAFEDVSAWVTAYDLVLVGARSARNAESSLASRELPPRVRATLARVGITSAAQIAGLAVAGDVDLRAWTGGAAPMRDDRPVIEFRAPRSAASGYCTDVLRWAVRPDFVAHMTPEVRDAARAERALMLRFLDELPHGFTAAADRLGAALGALAH